MTARMTPTTEHLLEAISTALEAKYSIEGKKPIIGYFVSDDGKGYQLSVCAPSGHRKSEMAPVNAHALLNTLRAGFSAMGFGVAQQEMHLNAEGVVIAPKFLSEVITAGALKETSDLLPKFAAAVTAATNKAR